MAGNGDTRYDNGDERGREWRDGMGMEMRLLLREERAGVWEGAGVLARDIFFSRQGYLQAWGYVDGEEGAPVTNLD